MICEDVTDCRNLPCLPSRAQRDDRTGRGGFGGGKGAIIVVVAGDTTPNDMRSFCGLSIMRSTTAAVAVALRLATRGGCHRFASEQDRHPRIRWAPADELVHTRRTARRHRAEGLEGRRTLTSEEASQCC
nr:hypothetical protein CFP56_00399 [Quercus suber]